MKWPDQKGEECKILYLWETCEEEEGCKINNSWRHPADLWPTEVTASTGHVQALSETSSAE